MYPEEGFFYISEAELMRLSYQPRFQGKPLAFVFLQFLIERDLLKSFEIYKAHNFYSKYHDKTGAFEILFADHSSFVLGTGAIHVAHPISAYFEFFRINYSYSPG